MIQRSEAVPLKVVWVESLVNYKCVETYVGIGWEEKIDARVEIKRSEICSTSAGIILLGLPLTIFYHREN